MEAAEVSEAAGDSEAVTWVVDSAAAAWVADLAVADLVVLAVEVAGVGVPPGARCRLNSLVPAAGSACTTLPATSAPTS